MASRATIFVFCSLCMVFSAYAADRGRQECMDFVPAGSLEESIDALVECYAAGEQPSFMGTILVAKDGETLYKKSFGSAWRYFNIPLTNDTPYRLGSITKAFTAVGVMILVEKGLLDLDERIQPFFPGAPAFWSDITVKDLLQNTSGIADLMSPQRKFQDCEGCEGNYGFDPFIMFWIRTGWPVSKQALLSRVYIAEQNFNPGEAYEYSNSNWTLLAELIEKVSGIPYEDYIHINVLAPAGMDQTHFFWMRFQFPYRVRSYIKSKETGVLNEVGYQHNGLFYGNGDLVSVIDDLLKWDRALTNNTIISQETFDMMIQGSERNAFWGMGMIINVLPDGKRVVSNGGNVEGFGTTMYRAIDDDALIVFLANTITDDPNNKKPITAIAGDIAALLGLVTEPEGAP